LSFGEGGRKVAVLRAHVSDISICERERVVDI
jgi:hypothetical protein